MACNCIEITSFVPDKLSCYHLFSYTSPEVPSFLTSFWGPPRATFPLPLDARVVAIPPTDSGAPATIAFINLELELTLFIFIYMMAYAAIFRT